MRENNSEECEVKRIIPLDYLRVIAVAILFFFHLGMIWVPEWQFHFKQQTQWYWLQHVMLLVSPWRMGLLWFIAGTSIWVMRQRYGLHFLLFRRSNAILLPLLIGIFFIVPIQLFVEMTQKLGIDVPLSEFFFQFYFGENAYFQGFSSGIWHHVDVNHLWFLRSLWRFTLLLVIFDRLLLTLRQRYCNFSLLWLCTLLIVTLGTMHIEDSDLRRDCYGFMCLLIGYFFGVSHQFWAWLKANTMPLLLSAISVTLVYETCFWLMRIEVGGDTLKTAFNLSYNVSKVVTLMAILAVSSRLFAHPNTSVARANQFVFPLYVFHQSVLVGVAYVVANYTLSPSASVLMTAMFSVIVCFLGLMVSHYNALVGLLFGKKPTCTSWLHSREVQIAIALITLPLGLKVIGVM